MEELNRLINEHLFKNRRPGINWTGDTVDSMNLLEEVKSGDLKIAFGQHGYRVFLSFKMNNQSYVTLWNGRRRGAAHPDLKIALALAVLSACGFERKVLSDIMEEKLAL